jgi:hypothetical protein
MKKTAFRCHSSQQTRRPSVNEHSILIQNTIVEQNGMESCCCGEQMVQEENKTVWHETTTWAPILEGSGRESRR